MKENFTIKDENGISHWISPSIAVTLVVLCYDAPGNPYVLLHKRGTGCPDNVGKLSVNCGYLNFEETLAEGAVRETYEEIGLKVPVEGLQWFGYRDASPTDRNVSHRFYYIANKEVLMFKIENGIINSKGSERGGEDYEVEKGSIQLIPLFRTGQDEECISDIPEDQFAFNHKELIMSVWSEIVKKSKTGSDIQVPTSVLIDLAIRVTEDYEVGGDNPEIYVSSEEKSSTMMSGSTVRSTTSEKRWKVNYGFTGAPYEEVFVLPKQYYTKAPGLFFRKAYASFPFPDGSRVEIDLPEEKTREDIIKILSEHKTLNKEELWRLLSE